MLDEVYEDGFGLDLVNKYIAHMTSQIAHRYPRMNILEIGAGTGGSTREILPRLGSAFSTYTYTDVSGGFFGTAEDRFAEFANRMIFKTFDMNVSPASQGFVENSYDLVIASNVLHATLELEDMMKHVRSFLKPGGFVIILETVNNDCLRVGLPMGSLEGWWLGAETGRRWGPTLTLPQWDSLLRKSGFGGIDTTTPPVHKILPGHVFCAQALDERVEMLRSPLQDLDSHPETRAPQLVIVGGETLGVHKVCQKVSKLLAPRFSEVVRINSIDELNSIGLPESSTVLSLTELDEPLFANLTAEKLEALKTLWRQSGNILWVTSGAKADNPHSYMSTGVGRCMRFEYPNITLQALDIDRVNSETPSLIAEHLVRMELLDKWSRELRPGELLWSLEPEIYIEDDATIIPRLYPYVPGNNRYNAGRRIVSEEADPKTAQLEFAGEDGKWEVQLSSPLHRPTALPFSADLKTIRVTHFLQSTVSVVPGANLFLLIGTDVSSNESVFAVSHLAESPVAVPSDWCIPLGTVDPAAALASISAALVSASILRLTSKGETIIIHDAHPLIAEALQKAAQKESVALHFTTAATGNNLGWQYIDKNLPRRLIKATFPETATKFINLASESDTSELGNLIVASLPRHCDAVNTTRLFGTAPDLRPSVSKETIANELKKASANLQAVATTALNIPIIPLQDIAGKTAAHSEFAAVDCTSSTVRAAARPIDDGSIFRGDRTYLLIGLSGELGQSLCKWMIRQGAKNIVLTSRRPNIHPTFFQATADMGANVKGLPM